MKQTAVYMRNALAGILTEDENGYSFRYEPEYLDRMPNRSA